MTDYQRVAKAIAYIKEHAAEQPNLDEIAEAVHLSSYHFHRMFGDWAGVTPKGFLQYISLEHAKKLLDKNQTIAEASFHTGLSGTGRLHDLFIKIEGMTPGEFKNGGRELEVRYRFSKSPFGQILIASTGKGICNLLFEDSRRAAIKKLNQTWPHANITEGQDQHLENLQNVFSKKWTNPDKIKLHIRGTDFQLKVWEALLKIPAGMLVSYTNVAEAIKNPKASRAVATALAHNPIAYLIPCHRVGSGPNIRKAIVSKSGKVQSKPDKNAATKLPLLHFF